MILTEARLREQLTWDMSTCEERAVCFWLNRLLGHKGKSILELLTAPTNKERK